MAVATPFCSPTADDNVDRIAVYLRVSTGHQNEENQRPDVEHLIKARFPHAEVTFYGERKSAAKVRPEYDRMLRDAKAGRFQVLVVWAVDRFGRSMSRNLNDVLALDAAGIRVLSCRESWLDMQGPFRNLLLAIFSWAAEQERVRITERINASVTRIREEGGALGRPGFGLRHVRDKKGAVAHIMLDDAKRPTLLKLAQYLIEAGSLRGAALRLQADGAPPPSKGGSWGHVAVKRTILNEELRSRGVWPEKLLAQVDSLLNGRRQVSSGAATPVNLASPFLACGACGGGLTVISSKKGGRSYTCGRCNTKGKAVCAGIGYRAKDIVERVLIDVVRSAVDGAVRKRALEVVRQRLDARPQIASERDAVAHALAESEREGKALAKAVAQGGKLDALVEEMKGNDQRTKQLRGRLARLEAAPVPLDTRRRIVEIERRLTELSKTLDEGGIAARPAVAAVLQGSRLTATLVTIKGERRWQLFGRISAGYLSSIDGSDPWPSCLSFRGPSASRRAWLLRPPSLRSSAASPPSSAQCRSRRGRPAMRCR